MDVVERVALVLLNDDRRAAGLRTVASRDNVPDSHGYVRNARAAIAALFDWMAEPSGNVIEAGYKAADDANEWENALIHWQAMLAEMRKEALGATPPDPPQ